MTNFSVSFRLAGSEVQEDASGFQLLLHVFAKEGTALFPRIALTHNSRSLHMGGLYLSMVSIEVLRSRLCEFQCWYSIIRSPFDCGLSIQCASYHLQIVEDQAVMFCAQHSFLPTRLEFERTTASSSVELSSMEHMVRQASVTCR